MQYEYTFYFANPLHFLLNFYAMKKIFSITAIILVLTAVFAYFHVNQRLSAVSLNEKTVILEIPKGSSPTKVLQILHEKGVWTDDLAFNLWCKLNKPALKAGWYEVPAHQTLDELTELFESAKVEPPGKSPPTLKRASRTSTRPVGTN